MSEGKNRVDAGTSTQFTDVNNFKSYLQSMGKQPVLSDSEIDTRSDFFLVLSRVRLDRAELMSWSLIQREQAGTKVVWIREI